jgi:thiazole synthase ThiGH ThiG subunit
MSELSNFQKNFLAGSGHVEVFTQKEFDEALNLARAEIMTVAIQTTKQAILIEREECAKLADECVDIEKLGNAIRNRIPAQRQ